MPTPCSLPALLPFLTVVLRWGLWMPEFYEVSLSHQGHLSHQEAGSGSPENNEIPAALPTQVLTPYLSGSLP